jgi:hypothetical protein
MRQLSASSPHHLRHDVGRADMAALGDMGVMATIMSAVPTWPPWDVSRHCRHERIGSSVFSRISISKKERLRCRRSG